MRALNDGKPAIMTAFNGVVQRKKSGSSVLNLMKAVTQPQNKLSYEGKSERLVCHSCFLLKLLAVSVFYVSAVLVSFLPSLQHTGKYLCGHELGCRLLRICASTHCDIGSRYQSIL